MKKKNITFLFLFTSIFIFSQNGFQLHTNKNKIAIPFKVSNNLVIIPIILNDVKLNFLLDTGLENTILFSLEDTDSINFNHVEKIKIKGLGSGESIDALISKRNTIQSNKYKDNNHDVYIILDQNINFSSQLGVPIHGIIGYDFFKNNCIEINYSKKKVYVFNTISSLRKKQIEKYTKIPISLEEQKPYITTFTSISDSIFKTKLLIDSGNTDAVWLFENKNIKAPSLHFRDFLGRGFGGDIFGKRSRINLLKMGNVEFKNPTTSFPDNLSLSNTEFVIDRNGSVGSEILKRFNIIYDYRNSLIYVKSNSSYKDPFNYNMSGLEIQHGGLDYVKERVELETSLKNNGLDVTHEPTRFKYQFVLKPLYVVSNVRENSPASNAGIVKGDIITKINHNNAYNYKLNEITSLFQSEEDRWIYIEYERNGLLYKTKFQLKKIL